MTSNIPSDVNFTNEQSMPSYFKAFINYANTQFKIHADKPFANYSNGNEFKSLTYAEIDLLSNNLACEWSEAAKNLKVVSFISDHNINYLIAMLALLKLRVTMLAISPRNSEAATVNLLERTQSKLVIATTKYESLAKASASQVSDVNVIVIDTAFDIDALLKKSLNPNHESLLDTGFSDEDIKKSALIIHSSGSTAFPKPIYLSNQYLFNLLNPFHINVNAKEGPDKIDHNDSFLSCTPL